MHEYLKNHIIEELEGAEDYWNKALENKENEYSKIFEDMANTELNHANSLFKIFIETQLKSDILKYLSYYDEIANAYTDIMKNIKEIKEKYSKG